MVIITALNLLLIIALGVLSLTLYSEIGTLVHRASKTEADIRNIRECIEADKYQLIETWNHAEKAVIRADSNARNLHDIETAVRRLQGWPEVNKDV